MIGLASVGLLGGVLALLVRLLNFFPAPVMLVPVECQGIRRPLAPGQRFTVMSWNLQYAASRQYHFFYDGGRAVHADRAVVERTLGGIAQVLRERSPDVLLLQEVDRDSARTARIDQLERLRRGAPWCCWTSATYHRSRFVPSPMHRFLGRVDLHLATAARFGLAHARRRALPQMTGSAIKRAFNLKRALLEVEVPLAGRDRPLVLINTHLDAFSHGDGTLHRQVAVILDRLAALDRRGLPWIFAGDLNYLPPGDSPARLPAAEARLYADRTNPLGPLFARHRPALPLDLLRRDPERYYTYLPFGARRPDRTIDYVFVSPAVTVHRYEVLAQAEPLSDHLPLLLEVSVQ